MTAPTPLVSVPLVRPLSPAMERFAEIEAERLDIAGIPERSRTDAQRKRFAELSREAKSLRKQVYGR